MLQMYSFAIVPFFMALEVHNFFSLFFIDKMISHLKPRNETLKCLAFEKVRLWKFGQIFDMHEQSFSHPIPASLVLTCNDDESGAIRTCEQNIAGHIPDMELLWDFLLTPPLPDFLGRFEATVMKDV